MKPQLAAVLPLLAWLMSGCAPGQAESPAAPPPPPEVTAAEVAIREVRDWADFTGRLEAVETVEVRPRVGGYVEAVHFDEGGRVAAGDLLYQIDPRPYRAEVERLRAERERAKARLALARTHYARAERLLAQNATSREEYEVLGADAAVAEAAFEAASAALEAAELDLSFTRVTAPITGLVSRRYVTAGNLVDSETLLTTIVADDSLYAYFDVDEQTYLELVRGAAAADNADVYVGLVNEQGYPHAARLDFVDNHVDPGTGTIRARAVLDNADGRFTPGLFARIRVLGAQARRLALVEDRAVGTDLGRKFVLVLDEHNVAQYRAVEIGRLVDELRVIEGGLGQGDVVVVNGLQRVRPGMAVAPTLVAMGGSDRRLASTAEPSLAGVR